MYLPLQSSIRLSQSSILSLQRLAQLASTVELAETQHPELWQSSAEQLLMTDELRASQRLVHMLGRIQNEPLVEPSASLAERSADKARQLAGFGSAVRLRRESLPQHRTQS